MCLRFQCNNPLTKEPKLEAAQRIVPEWVDYDQEARTLWDSVFKSQESSPEKDSKNVKGETSLNRSNEFWIDQYLGLLFPEQRAKVSVWSRHFPEIHPNTFCQPNLPYEAKYHYLELALVFLYLLYKYIFLWSKSTWDKVYIEP